jgi:hypothetical protein
MFHLGISDVVDLDRDDGIEHGLESKTLLRKIERPKNGRSY